MCMHIMYSLLYNRNVCIIERNSNNKKMLIEGFYTEVFSIMDFTEDFVLLEAFSVYLTISTIY